MKYMNNLKIYAFFSIILLSSINSTYAVENNNTFTFDSYKNTNNSCFNNVAKQIKNGKYQNFYCNSTYGIEYNILNGEIAYQSNRYDMAETYLKKGLEQLNKKIYNNPENKYLLYNQFARIYLINKDYKRALEYSDKAFNSPHLEKEFIATRIKILEKEPILKPKSLIKILTISGLDEDTNFFDNAEDWNKILQILNEIDIKYEKSTKTTFGEALYLTKKQINSFNKKQKELINSLVQRAKLELSFGYYNDALMHIRQANHIERNEKEKFKLSLCEVEILLETKQFTKTITLINQMLDIHSNDKKIYLYYIRSQCYIQLKKYDDALDDISKIINLNEKNPEAYKLKGMILLDLKKYDESIKNFEKALSIDETFTLPQNILNYILNSTNDYNKAVSLINMFGKNEDYAIEEKIYVINRLLINQNKYQNAINELNKIEINHKNIAKLYTYLGICYEKQNNNQLAFNYYKKALNMKEPDTYSYYCRGNLYLKLKKYKEALYDAEQYKNFDFGDARTKELLYKVYLGLGNYTKALENLQDYTDNGSYYDDLDQIYSLALIKAKLGDSYGALITTNKLIDYALSYNDTQMYAKALKLKKNIYQPAQINIIFNIFISAYY